MASWARSKFGAAMFEPKVFRKQMYYVEESTCNIVGAFRCFIVIRCLRNFSPLPALVTPLMWHNHHAALALPQGIVQRETRLYWRSNLCNFHAYAYENESTFEHELFLD